MYSNIPVKETIEITKTLLAKQNLNPIIIEELIKLLTEITNQNYFTFSNKFYTQSDGLPMGSPLSGTLANIYLNYIENTQILNNKNKYFRCITYWHRYVDDILVLFTGTNRQLDLLLNYINNIHHNIKFTLELEQNGSINFLDLNIKNINQQHTFKIYRKPTQTDQTIDITSNHPWQHKMAAYNHLICRLNNVPMSNEDYTEEFNTIKFIAQQNGYKPKTIDLINTSFINKMLYRRNTTLQFDDDERTKKCISLEFNMNTSQHINKIFQNFGYTTSYKTNSKLGKLIKFRNQTNLETGMYKLKCSDCDAFYIGQTGRSFEQRFKEHIREIGKINCESSYALHINTTLHNYEGINQNLEVIQTMRKSNILDRIEEIEIYKNRNNPNLLNSKINTTTNKLYDLILENIQ